MPSVQLIHNPRAGDQVFDSTRIIDLLEKNGYECGYLSTKKRGWKEFSTGKDLLVIAGGDGTVRKVVKQILKKSMRGNPARIVILPLGTANNIASTFGIDRDLQQAIDGWKTSKIKKFDVGRVRNKKEHLFFIESFGYGLFPCLMEEMQKLEKLHSLSSKDEIQKAWEVLHQTVLTYEATGCTIRIDGKKYSGKFLIAEIVNTPFIGPNLHISPESDPGDGLLEVVLVAEQDRMKLADYISSKQAGKKNSYSFQTIKGRNISIKWGGNYGHVDDKTVWLEKNTTVAIKLQKGRINFLVPQNKTSEEVSL